MATCLHGSDPQTCLVCQVLRDTGGPGSTGTSAAVKPTKAASRRSALGAARLTPSDTGVSPTKVRGGRDPLPRSRRGHIRSALSALALTVIAVIIGVIAFWFLVGTLHAILHLFELAVVAAAALVVGFRAGRWVGRRGH